MATDSTRLRRRRLARKPTRAEALGRRSLTRRLTSAIRRRTAYAWRRLTLGTRPPPVEAAFEWLIRHGAAGSVPTVTGDPVGCPAATGGAIETMWAFGATHVPRRWARWLLSIQRPDGALPDAAQRNPSLWNTAQAVRGLLAVESDVSEAQAAALSACRYLCSCLDGDRMPLPEAGSSPNTPSAEMTRVGCLPPLLHAARCFKRADWEAAVWRTAARCAQTARRCRSSAPSHVLARRVEALIELGYRDLAADVMRPIDLLQRRDGSVPASADVGWVSSTGLAHLAVCWYKLGRRDRADRAMRCLARRQRSTGGFCGSWGRGAGDRPTNEVASAVNHYLDAARLQVQTAFETESSRLPNRIDPADGRVQAVRRWFTCLPLDARVADVGCGRGRFLRHLSGWFPQAGLTGVDVSAAMLCDLPQGVTALQGSLLRIPAPDAAFDGAFAVESLEHALLPRQAVSELCRVVRPGGRVLIIDKHRARQPLSQHDPWERWFTPDELAGWLTRHCREVTVQPISHLESRPGTNLFLAAAGSLKP